MAPSSFGGPRVWWREPPPAAQDQPAATSPKPSLFEPAAPTRPPSAPPPVDATVEMSAVPPAPSPEPSLIGEAQGPSGQRYSLLAITGVVMTVIGLILVTIVGITTLTSERSGPTTTGTVAKVPHDAISATASSTQTADSGITYAIDNTLDGDPVTAWNSDGDTDGRGPGITLTYSFSSTVDLRSITVLNGYQKVRTNNNGSTVDLYTLNNRVRQFLVVTDGGQWTWDLMDSKQAQTLSESFGPTRQVVLKVLAVYESDRYKDLAISEVSFAAAV